MVFSLKKFIPILTLALSILVSQDLTSFFRMVEEGQIDQVREEIPRLLENYPDHPGILYLDAVTTERAENAIVAYKRLIQNHPSSQYVDDAMIRVGEYLFARGLYTQASRELSKIPRIFPRSQHVQRAIDLQINSLLAIGERDSADYYIRVYQNRFSNLDFEYNLEPETPLINRPLTAATIIPLTEGMKQPTVESLNNQKKSPTVPNEQKESVLSPEPKTSSSIPRPFVIQIGAYGSIDNALRQKISLEQKGYDVELVPITPGGKTLQAVQVVRFVSRADAEAVGRKLKSDFGYNFLVMRRPE